MDPPQPHAPQGDLGIGGSRGSWGVGEQWGGPQPSTPKKREKRKELNQNARKVAKPNESWITSGSATEPEVINFHLKSWCFAAPTTLWTQNFNLPGAAQG